MQNHTNIQYVDMDLAAIRKESGVTQKEICVILNVTRQTVYTYENTKKVPKYMYDRLMEKCPNLFRTPKAESAKRSAKSLEEEAVIGRRIGRSGYGKKGTRNIWSFQS